MSTQLETGFQARLILDDRLPKMQQAGRLLSRPPGGWIRHVRLALGMSSSELAKKLGVEVSTISRLEQNEAADRVKLETLRKVADELGCDLVYALVPRQSIESTLKTRALALARTRVNRLQNTMVLEKQGLSSSALSKLVDQEAESILRSGKVWK